jgi:hypothetical protein
MFIVRLILVNREHTRIIEHRRYRLEILFCVFLYPPIGAHGGSAKKVKKFRSQSGPGPASNGCPQSAPALYPRTPHRRGKGRFRKLCLGKKTGIIVPQNQSAMNLKEHVTYNGTLITAPAGWLPKPRPDTAEEDTSP